MTPQNPPQKHHYIPAFFLKRWANLSDKKLTEFTRPFGPRVKIERPMAKSTGYDERLYSLEGYDTETTQQVEENFFSPLDENASEALRMLEKHGHFAKWNEDSRTAWTRFILSLLLRCPEDVGELRAWWSSHVFDNPSLVAEKQYLGARGPDDPESFAGFLKAAPESLKSRRMLEVLCGLIINQDRVTEINRMEWRVMESPSSAPSLLISDRPVIRSASLNGAGAYIALPIGPRLVFIASPDLDCLQSVRRENQIKLVKTVNLHVVQGAHRFVWSVDDSQKRFVERHFGAKPRPWLLSGVQQQQIDVPIRQ